MAKRKKSVRRKRKIAIGELLTASVPFVDAYTGVESWDKKGTRLLWNTTGYNLNTQKWEPRRAAMMWAPYVGFKLGKRLLWWIFRIRMPSAGRLTL